MLELHRALAPSLAKASKLVRFGFINGLPGFVSIEEGDVLQTTALEIDEDGIAAIYVVRNPEKLQNVRTLVPSTPG